VLRSVKDKIYISKAEHISSLDGLNSALLLTPEKEVVK
jgi:hypothetical protein